MFAEYKLTPYLLPARRQDHHRRKNIVSKIISPNAPLALKVENLRKSFGTNEVLKGISLEAREGEVISILGSSGSGKSTFLRCINLLEIPTPGMVTVSGETIRMAKNSKGEAYPADKKQVSRIRSELAWFSRVTNLWSHKTILENIIEAPIYRC